MKHRHIDIHHWDRTALFSLLERGTRNDLLDFMKELKSSHDDKLLDDFLFVSKKLGIENFSKTMVKAFEIGNKHE
jgi:hypothetical protein